MRSFAILCLSVAALIACSGCVSVIDTVQVNVNVPKPCSTLIKVHGIDTCKTSR